MQGKLYIQQKLLSLREKFSVKDEAGADKYFIEGEFLSFGQRLHIKNSTGKEVALVKEQLLTIMPKFSVEIDGKEAAEIIQKFTFFRPKYEISGLNWSINGNVSEHDYKITKGNDLIATIHKKWLSWGDCFEIDLKEGTDEVMALSVVLAIDCVLDAEERRRNK